MWKWVDEGMGAIMPPPVDDNYGLGLGNAMLQRFLRMQQGGAEPSEEAIMGALPDTLDHEVISVLNGDDFAGDDFGRSEEKLEKVIARKRAELKEQQQKLASANTGIAKAVHKKRIKEISEDIERLERKLAKKQAKSGKGSDSASDASGGGSAMGDSRYLVMNAPPGRGRLVTLNLYVEADISSGDWSGTKAANPMLKAVVPASGESSEITLVSPNISFAKFVVLGLKATTLPQRDTGSDFQIKSLATENDANLLLSPTSKWSDISAYRWEDVNNMPGLRNYPIVISPNKISLGVRAVGDNGDVVRGSFQVVVDVLEDTLSTGPQQRQTRPMNSYGA